MTSQRRFRKTRPAHPDAPDGLNRIDRFDWERVVHRLMVRDELRLFGLALSYFADQFGEDIYPGVALLGEMNRDRRTGDPMSPATVRRRLDVFRVDLRLIELMAKGGNGKASVYRLVVPDDLTERAILLRPGTFELPDGAESALIRSRRLSADRKTSALKGPQEVSADGGNSEAYQRSLSEASALTFSGISAQSRAGDERPPSISTHQPLSPTPSKNVALVSRLTSECPHACDQGWIDQDGGPSEKCPEHPPARQHGQFSRIN